MSASKHHWVGYDEDKFIATYNNHKAAQKGSELHDLASNLIKHGVKLPRSRKTMNLYVNDAIGFRMTPEQVLYYSDNFFGTADAISFRDNVLRIHDLKTGVNPASMRQLEVYTALFCLEYDQKPGLLDIELRIYQNDDVVVHSPDVSDILHIMDRGVSYDNLLNKLKLEEQM